MYMTIKEIDAFAVAAERLKST